MADAENLHIVFEDFIDYDVGPRGEHQLPRIGCQSDAPAFRKCSKRCYTFVNRLGNALCGRRLLCTDAFDNSRKISCG
jgi:hypothetical protein